MDPWVIVGLNDGIPNVRKATEKGRYEVLSGSALEGSENDMAVGTAVRDDICKLRALRDKAANCRITLLLRDSIDMIKSKLIE